MARIGHIPSVKLFRHIWRFGDLRSGQIPDLDPLDLRDPRSGPPRSDGSQDLDPQDLEDPGSGPPGSGSPQDLDPLDLADLRIWGGLELRSSGSEVWTLALFKCTLIYTFTRARGREKSGRDVCYMCVTLFLQGGKCRIMANNKTPFCKYLLWNLLFSLITHYFNTFRSIIGDYINRISCRF